MKKNLSIIIPTWNTAAITLSCLRSLHRHLRPLDYEIIVVDNASTDDSVLKLKKFKKSFDIRNLPIRQGSLTLKINSKNLGFARACNIGARQASGQYLLFLNSDIELLDNSLHDMLKHLQQDPQIGAIGPLFLDPNHHHQASVFPPQNLINAFQEFFLGRKFSFSKYLPPSNKASNVWAISGGAIMLRKNVFKKIGGWNEKYFMYFEDLDLCRQLRNLHLKIVYFPQARLIHHHGASGHSLANSQRQWQRLVPSSLQYHGIIKHYCLFLILWLGQKFQKIFS